MQEFRLYFPSFQATQLVCGVNTSYSHEIDKLRKFGLNYVIPHFRRTTLTKYPFKITFTFFSISDQDSISTLTIASFIIHLLESNSVIQSSDYRVTPQIVVNMKKIKNSKDEGCHILIEKYHKSKD